MFKTNIRKYGQPDYNIICLHGGPGAVGTMQPVALKLSERYGVLEALQTSVSIEGQVSELKDIINNNTRQPVILVGHSYGAWLAYILAAKNPDLVEKIILIGSPPFEEKYTSEIMNNRLRKLDDKNKTEFVHLLNLLNQSNQKHDKNTLNKFFKMLTKTDSFSPLPQQSYLLEFRFDIYQKVWQEASNMRKDGSLLELAKNIYCPIIIIHGNSDPHTAEGVIEPLGRYIIEIKSYIIPKCGHYPWMERYANKEFYDILLKEMI
ncbi:MAG: putative hydrolase [Ignavibacteria bacterium]|nr:putative hydrolase [Ignavibacteria bacterium]